MTVTTDSGAFFVPPQFAVWMPAGVVHRIHARGAVAMRTLYVRRDAIVGLPDDVCVLEVSRLLRELVLTAVSYTEYYAPDGPEDRLMQVVLDQLRQQRTAPLALAMPLGVRAALYRDLGGLAAAQAALAEKTGGAAAALPGRPSSSTA